MAAEEDRFGLWMPVAFAAGAAGYFSLPMEPSGFAAALAGVAALGFAAVMIWRRRINWPALLIVFLIAGALTGKARVDLVDTPLLRASTGMVSVTGWVRRLERLGGRWRVVLDVEGIENIRPEAAPRRVRLSAPASHNYSRGERLRVKARLYPLHGPAEPGAWNPARGLWFDGIGASGYTMSKPQSIGPPAGGGFGQAVANLRDAMAARIRAALPGEAGGMAIALIVGERGEIPRQAQDNLRISGLAHILAISGLHMSLVAGGIFWVVRALLAFSPWLAAGYPIKKWSAVAALAAGAGYLMLSGAAVATQRAFVMLAVMSLAVLIDRPAISMRNLAIAAFAVMLLSPEAVTGASFQMSFLAVASLIAFYEAVSAWRRSHDTEAIARGPLWQAMRWAGLFIVATAATTLIAGTATAVPAAFHFHRVSSYSLIANVLGLPLVSLIVMPAAVVSVFAMPFGLEGASLWVMGKGIEAVLWVAGTVAGLPGAGHYLAAIPATAALAMAAGVLWLALWHGRIRLIGAGLFALGVMLAPLKPAPDVLIDSTAAVVALRNGDGRLAPTTGHRGRYVVTQWLMADGDSAKPAEAAKRPGWTCDKAKCSGEVAGHSLIYLRDEKAAVDCGSRDIAIAAFPLRGRCKDAGVRIDRFDVWRNGAHALIMQGQDVRIETARQLSGKRPWSVEPVARSSILSAPVNTQDKAGDTKNAAQ